jgi:2-methylisocitrate lyase-like PEP mutase family enzyme
MFDAPAAMRALLKADGLIARPAVCDPLMARAAQSAGFKCLGVGGFVMGAHTTLTEPQMTMTELIEESRRIQAAVTVPVMLDVGAGFGEAIQVWRTVQEAERAGLAGIQMEDQVYPKRAHYHRDYVEHTIELEHMVEKIGAAIEARSDKNFVLLARTDSMRTGGFAEGVKRANAYVRAGADLIMMFPNTLEETRRAPKEIDAPLVYVVSHGNRVGRPVPSTHELEDMGYKIASYAILSILVTYRAFSETFRRLHDTGDAGVSLEEMREVRKEIEDLIGLPKLYEIEERTTEKSARPG